MECLMAIGTWITGKIADYTVAPVGHKLGYIFHYKRNVGNLISETQDLNLEKRRIEDLVDVARRNGEEIHDHVNDWLCKVGEITKEAEKLLGDENHTDIKCTFRASFQNLVQRYRLGRKAEKMGESVVKIRGKVRFDSISYRPKLRSNFRNKDFINFDTRKEITTRIMEALEDGNVKMVGVYGMPGAGKTTLVKEIAKEALDKSLFKDAIVITVSQTPNLKNIQREVAEKLDLKLDKKSIGERSLLLQNRLKGEEKFLIILDDVWNNELNLEDVGIVFESDDQKGIKILLTSRFERVLNDDMGVQKSFPIELLSEDEAWDLFSHIVGDSVKNPDFRQCGEEIVEECACLPIAVVTIAHALKNRALPFWRDALGQLQRSNLTIKDMHEKVYSRIKLCYDYLQSEEAKSLLLLCCLGGEDAIIQMEYLMRFGIGLDIFKGVRTLQEARDRVYSLVDDLKDRCLLLDGDESGTVKMHDVIYDVAISIAKERYMYCFSDGVEVEECKRRKKLEDARAISSNGYVSALICESFEYKQLELILIDETESDTISNNLFEKMKELRVLGFISQHMEVLPTSLCFLQNLRTLCMVCEKLDDVALIGELKNLEILDLSESPIEELPTQIGQLTCLRVLDLSECKKLRVIHPNIIPHLTRLEELYMDFKNWDKDIEVVNGEKRNASLLELKHLVRLTTLELRVPDIRMLSQDLFSETLERYKILIQVDNEKEVEEHIGVGLSAQISPSRYLAISKNNESIILHDYGLETLLRRSHVLHFSELQGVNNIVYELDKKGFQELKRLYLKGNDKIRYLINTMEHINCSAAFASLESLSLVSLTKLEKISHGELVAETFKRLSIIKVSKCERLKNLLPFSIATQLEEIEIKDCQMMEEIVTHELNDDEEEEEDKIVDEFPHLCSLKLVNVTKLRKFCSKMKKTPSQNEEEPLIVDSTMPFFDGKFVSFPKLAELKLSGCDFTKIWDDQFQLSSTSFRNLTKLVLQSCNFMKNLFSSAVAVSLEQLCSLDVSGCRMMEEAMTRNERIDKMSFPKLNFLALNNLPNLVSFSSGIFIEFPMLDQLYIQGCPAFETFISNTEQNLCTGTMPSLFNEKAAFPSLNKVVIQGMDKLRMIWQYDDEISTANFFCKLKYVTVINCKNLMKIIPSSMQRRLHNVTHLCINDCNLVEEVFEIQMSNNSEETYPAVPAQLTDLRLFRLAKLKFVWSKDPQATVTFPHLEKVVASECPSLESIFPPSIAKGLFQLKGLDINSCGIERIVAKEEGSEKAPPEFVFPQLGEMQLKYLPNLVCFYPSLHTSSWPLLTRLYMIQCMKVKLFPSEFIQETNVSARCETFPVEQTSFFTKFYFPRLEKLQLFKFHFQKIWDDPLVLGSTPFRQLTILEVVGCEFLTSLFPSAAMAASLEHLNSIEIRECRKMEEIIISRNQITEKLSFSKLKRLNLRNLPSLVRFSSEIFIEFPVLNELSIQDCHQFGTFISKSEENSCTTILSLFNQKFVSFPKLEKLEILGCHFKKIWVDQPVQWSTSFHNLTNLVMIKCDGLKNLFSYAISASFEQLCFLEVRDCIIMEEIVMSANERMDKMSFPKLRMLKLKNLPSLVRFSSANFIEFPQLTELSMKGCSKFGTSISLSEDNLCTTVSSVFNKFVSFPILENLKLSGCHFTKIWDDQLLPSSLSLDNLKILTLDKCKFLKNLCTSTIALSLEGLRALRIRDCKMMEEIMSNNEMMEKVSFPDLEYLELENLPSLASFSSTIFLEFPLLTTLSINDCLELKGFISKLEENFSVPIPPLFNEKAAFPKLNGMQIGGIDTLKIIWHSELAADSFCRLENLTVKNCKNLMKIIPSHMYHRLCNLKSLEIRHCEMIKEVGLTSMMLINQGQFTADFFGKLEEINVYNCKSLTKMFSYNVLIRLQNLSKLVISNCEMMEEVFDLEIPNDHQETYEITHFQLKELSLAILPKLKHVWSKDSRGIFKFLDLQSFIAYQCQSLKNLFPTSVAKSLLKLQKLHITNCAIEEIVAKDEGIEIEPQNFVFPQFEELVLVNLPNLVSFYPGLHTSSWPSLSKMDVVECMKVKVLMSEVFSFQEIHGLTHDDIPFQQPLFLMEKVGVGTPRVMMISQDQLTAGIFGKLKEIKVNGCKSLTKMFSSNILRRLHNLSKLVISNCEMMEEVFEIETSNDHHHDITEATVTIHLTMLQLSLLPKLKHVWSNDPRGTFTFQDLQELNANECQSLKILFPTSVAKNLLQFRSLVIRNCGIEQIVGKEEGQDQAIPTFVFPQLNALTLHNLPQLMCFYPGLHALRLPLLRWLQVSYFMKAKDLSLKFLRFQDRSRLIDYEHISFHEPLLSIDKVTSSSQYQDPVGDQEECAGTLSCLRGLRLYDMPNLLHLREESSQPQTVFQNLIDLDILRCGRIKKLVPSSISFQNLVTLKIRQCHGMPSLLTSQTARSMAQLQCLIIFDCKRMAEIIVDADEGEDIEGGEITFARLKTLILDCLPSLTSFYLGKYMLGFPDLENVTVSRCFELQSFSQHGHTVSTPKLHKLVTVGADHKVIDDINTIMAVNTPMDLNTTIPELWNSHPCTTLQELFSGKDLAPQICLLNNSNI
ncbi:uncharacterized protein LOC125421229 isoform X2 [Ziziphus jujuba]|uniref:Uncharacterized protein LOC125421229 isoform X2 n=1 Tax=Ziziphus jujuba TaxID=326968 RepID=A0ABM4AH22_ZIZJJ|nr:uncharacterized protein LOC125421229 isoform X2 [Ziziphus jujuba]